MNAKDVIELLNNGENSRVEFKSETVSNAELAVAMVSFLNGGGGTVLLGVEDDASITGTSGSADRKMNAIYQICQNSVKPLVIPEIDVVKIDGKTILAITLEKGVQKPYYILKNEKTLYYIRSGTTCRLASPEQIAVLYASHPAVHFDASPLPEATLDDLDERRLRQYFTEIKRLSAKQYEDRREFLCKSSRIAAPLGDRACPTMAGVLLFARQPSRFAASAGIRCAAFEGTRKDYAMTDSKFLDAPILPYLSGEVSGEDGLIEQAAKFVVMNTRTASIMKGIRRVQRPDYPPETIRETIVNALVHRDYSLLGGQIQLLVFSDRIEVRSPGRLPNTLTMEMIQTGASYARNPILMKFAENYGYVEHLGLGIPEKIVRPMLENGHPPPEFLDTGYEFAAILKKG